MSKPWGDMGTWAEQAEAEEQEAAAAASVEPQSFPSLREAVSSKTKKKTKMSLTEFYSSSSAGGGGGFVGLTPDEMLRLPTGPKDRTGEEMQYGRLGGGFSNYGGRGGGRARREGDVRRGYGGGFEGEERRGGSSRVSELDQPSRADEVDNWAVGKKQISSFDTPRQHQSRYGSLGGSRADEVDNWSAGKKPVYAHSGPVRSSFGSGFRDSGPELDRWSRGNRQPELERDSERPKLVLNPPKGANNEAVNSVNASRPNPFGPARPREEVLAEKGLDWKKIDIEIEAKRMSGSTSAHSSRPSSAQSSRSETAPGLQQGVENSLKVRPKVNPFGDAKPREVLLQERGQDWRKMDLELEHRSVDRPETEEEKVLKEEIDHLKEELHKESSQGDQSSLKDILSLKEKDLELLSRELDDKVKFGQKAVERPGSAAGRAPTATYPERPPSQSGSIDGSRSMEFRDRPRSRGMQASWSRPGDDRRGFQSGRERGFLGSRDNFDRPRSRERW